MEAPSPGIGNNLPILYMKASAGKHHTRHSSSLKEEDWVLCERCFIEKKNPRGGVRYFILSKIADFRLENPTVVFITSDFQPRGWRAPQIRSACAKVKYLDLTTVLELFQRICCSAVLIIDMHRL